MEKSFDFGALLKIHATKHKKKPTQFVSVAGGVQKRLERNLKHIRSSRLTVFDRIRNLSQSSRSNSPEQVSKVKEKIEHRRQQLEKWKEEKEKRKKVAAAHKRKPFLTGVPHNPLKYVPPPPPPKAVSNTSGRVTRSQSARIKKTEVKQPKQTQLQSFAPKNAIFHAPNIKNLTNLPNLALNRTKKDKKAPIITFEPILPSSSRNEVRSTRSRIYITQNINSVKTKCMSPKNKTTKPIPRAPIKYVPSSSSSENESSSQMKISSTSGTDLTDSMPSSSNDERKSPHAVSSKPKTHRKSATPRKSTRLSLAAELKVNTPKNPVPKSESSSEERLRSPKSPVEVMMTPEQIAEEAKRISPCVTISRGKANARNEMINKLKQGLLDEDTCELENIDHFRRQLASETKRITEMCDTWDKILEQLTLPETVQELVLGAVGQARLLMSQKMQQFASLVERCARPDPGTALVTPADLLGFWDMLFMQVVNVDMRFKKLEELKSRDWREETAEARAPRRPVPRAQPPPKPRASAPSRLRDMIAAARKAKKQELQPPAADDTTFEGGFFSVRSPRSSRSPSTPSTPSRGNTLLKAVLSSEANKASASASKKSTSFAMLRASVLGKNVECDGVAPLPQTPLPQVNIYATPGRSILKQAQDNTNKLNKSIKCVLFDNEIEPNSSSENVTEQSEAMPPTDTSISSMDMEEKVSPHDKENSGRKSKLIRQDAVNLEDRSPVMTRSRRKSKQTPQTEKAPKRSTRKKKVLEVENVVQEIQSPKRSTRTRKSVV